MIYFYSNTYNEFTAVTFQFSRIGNDPGAAKLLEDLDKDRDLRESIDVLPVEFDLKCLLATKWFVVCHNQLFSKLIEFKTEVTDLVIVFENSYRGSCLVQFYLM